MRRYPSFEEYLDESLKDPQHAADYLNAIIEEDPSLLPVALADVARAHGVSKFARMASISRVGLYKSLSPKGNPGLQTLLGILKASGLRLSFTRA